MLTREEKRLIATKATYWKANRYGIIDTDGARQV